MELKGAQQIYKWNQDLTSKKSGYPDGMCILIAFHFGARRMLHMEYELAIQETIQLETVQGSLVLRSLSEIYRVYLEGHGHFHDEVFNIARQYELHQIANPLRFNVIDYDHFDITNKAAYGTKGLHGIVAEDILYHYYSGLHSSGFLMIGIKTKSGNSHALSLLLTPEDKMIIFDPNYGWYFINDPVVFMNAYGELANIVEWDLVLIKQE